MRFGKYRAAAALAAAAGAAVITAIAPSASAITGPFTWTSTSTQDFCPSWHGQSGCNTAQTPTGGYTTSMDPAQVSVNGSNAVVLAISSDGTKGGAINTNDTSPPGILKSYSFPSTITEKWFLPCTSVGGTPEVENTPSFWFARTTAGTVAGEGEIDVMEGNTGGVLDWVYWYNNGLGGLGKKSGTLTGPTGFPCGTGGTGGAYTFSTHWISSNAHGVPEIDISVNSVIKGGVSANCANTGCVNLPAGISVDTSARYLIDGYGQASFGGPSVNGVAGQVQTYQYANS